MAESLIECPGARCRASAHGGASSIAVTSWRRRETIAFALMVIIPLLAIGYILSVHVFPQVEQTETVAVVLLCNVALVLAGFAILRGVVISAARFRNHMAAIAAGDLTRIQPEGAEPDIAKMSESLNKIIEKLHHDRDQLQSHARQLDEQVEGVRSAFSSIVDKSSDAILVLDTDGVVRFANRAAHAMLRRDDGPITDVRHDALLEAGESKEISIERGGGEKGMGEMRKVKTEWDGKPAHLVCIRDVTEIVQARKLLAEEREDLRELNEAKSQFVAEASHELRTPLATVREFASLVHDEVVGPLTAKQKECLRTAVANCDRMKGLIGKMLDLARIEAGKIEVNRVGADAVQLLTECRHEFLSQCRARNQRLLFEPPADLPAVRCDVASIREVLANLVDNASKFTHTGGTIRIGAEPQGEFVSVFVEDDGPGIAPEKHEAIFEPFVQVNTEYGPGTKGAGLGLAITKKLVTLNRGYMTVDSTPEKGSRFSFMLPVYKKTPSSRVLVVDDNVENLKLIGKALQASHLDLEVQSTSSGLECLVIAGRFNPDLVVLDVHLAEISGLQVLRSLKKKGAGSLAKVLLISADEEAMMRTKEQGADDHLLKPFSPRDLIKKVVTLLGIERRTNEREENSTVGGR